MKKLTLKDLCNALRAEIKATENHVRSLRQDDEFHPPAKLVHGSGVQTLGRDSDVSHGAEVSTAAPARPRPQYGEMDENLTLVVRHLEDARMRLGKVIQASEGGESIFDRKD